MQQLNSSLKNMKNNKYSIGIFDSGLGGLTVLHQLKKKLPLEKFIYFGDTAHIPYGNKSRNIIEKYCLDIIEFLKDKKIKLIIVACNSASSVALKAIKKIHQFQLLMLYLHVSWMLFQKQKTIKLEL